MDKKSKKCPHAFYERGSWYHRTKILQEDYSVKYGKTGGFSSDVEAEKDYEKHIKEFNQSLGSRLTTQGADISLKDYLIYWYQSIFSERIVSTTEYLSAYVLYTFLLPSIDNDVKLRTISSEYLDEVLKKASRYCESAGNKSRELLYIAFKDALSERMINDNPVLNTKKYPRKKPKIYVLNKDQIRTFLAAAKQRNWFLEIILALYLGLRKGEIRGLKFNDFNFEERTVHIQRQLAMEMKLQSGGIEVEKYQLVERDPKTEKSNWFLRVPTIVMVELEKRKQRVLTQKIQMGDRYQDNDYVCCQKNGLPHGPHSLNKEIRVICENNSLPHITVHGLRHMFATILLERDVSIAKISGMLGHSSIHTTFEYYLEVMDADKKIVEFMNREFIPDLE